MVSLDGNGTSNATPPSPSLRSPRVRTESHVSSDVDGAGACFFYNGASTLVRCNRVCVHVASTFEPLTGGATGYQQRLHGGPSRYCHGSGRRGSGNWRRREARTITGDGKGR